MKKRKEKKNGLQGHKRTKTMDIHKNINISFFGVVLMSKMQQYRLYKPFKKSNG